MNIKSVKGMNDIFEPEIFGWRFAESKTRAWLESFGFTEIKTPVVEMTSLFMRSVGDTTDIVQKEMYTFNDRNNESLTLRPEGTAAVVRALVEHNLLNNDPVQKLYYWGPMFRYERPQKGRHRQFYQYGLEFFGVEQAWADAEVIGLLAKLYTDLGLKDLSVRLSSMGCENCRPVYKKQLVELLKPSMQILCPDCQKRLETNPFRILDCKNPTCKEVASVLPSMLDFLDQPCQEHFDEVRDHLVRIGTAFVVDKRLVRGLDYYNKTVFEITTNALGAQNAVGGGGRYDKLVSDLGGPTCPAVGYAGGVERLILLLGESRIAELKPKLKLFIVCPDKRGMEPAFQLAFNSRANGISVDLDYTGKSMKSQMKKADKFAAQFVLILGGNELDQGIGILRDMTTKAQENIKLAELETDLMRRLK